MPTLRNAPLFLLLAALLGAGSACRREGKPVAVVEGNPLSPAMWQAFLASHPGLDTSRALEEVVRREVAWTHALRGGGVLGPEWDEFQRLSRREVLARACLEAQPGPAPLGEEAVQARLRDRAEERRVRHILSATKAESEVLLQKLGKGVSFEACAAESKDAGSAARKGELGWIRRDQMVPAFAQAVFGAAPGKVVGPFQSEFGWHLAEVLEVRHFAGQDLARVEAALRRELEEQWMEERRKAVLPELRKSYPLEANRAVLALDKTTIPEDGDEGRIAGKVAGSSISLLELKKFLGDYLKTAGQTHSLGPETKLRFMEILADDIRLAAKAESDGTAGKPEVLAKVWDAQRQGALQAFSKLWVARYAPTEAELQQHHREFPDAFRGPGELRLNFLVLDRALMAEAAIAEARAGRPWAALVARYANRASTGNWDPGWVPSAALGKVLGPQAVRLLEERPLGQVLGPLQGPDGQMLFKVLERKAGPPLPLDACRDRVAEDFRRRHGMERLLAFLDGEGRKGLSIQTFPDRLQARP